MKATFGRRVLAYLIDCVLVGTGLSLLVGFCVGVLQLSQAWITPLTLLLWWTYMVVRTARQGQTLGKRALKIKVTGPDGTPPGWGRVLVRETVGRMLSGLIFGLGYLWMLWDPERRCWHDMIAGTRVVRAD